MQPKMTKRRQVFAFACNGICQTKIQVFCCCFGRKLFCFLDFGSSNPNAKPRMFEKCNHILDDMCNLWFGNKSANMGGCIMHFCWLFVSIAERLQPRYMNSFDYEFWRHVELKSIHVMPKWLMVTQSGK